MSESGRTANGHRLECMARRRQPHLDEWIATVDEQAASRDEHMRQPLERTSSRLGMAAIERTDPHGERQIVPWLSPREHQIFEGNAAKLQLSGRQLGNGACHRRRDCRGRAVDGQNAAPANSMEDCTSCRSRAAPDLQHPHAGSKRQRFDNLRQPGGNLPCHAATKARPARTGVRARPTTQAGGTRCSHSTATKGQAPRSSRRGSWTTSHFIPSGSAKKTDLDRRRACSWQCAGQRVK